MRKAAEKRHKQSLQFSVWLGKMSDTFSVSYAIIHRSIVVDRNSNIGKLEDYAQKITANHSKTKQKKH